MFLHTPVFQGLVLFFFGVSIVLAHDVKLLPKPNGPFSVAINTMELTDTNRLDPFAPTKTPRRIMVSAIYPVEHTSSTCRSPYMPRLTAQIEDASFTYPAGSYESLFLQVGCTSRPHDDAPLVLFSPAQGTPRLDYNLLVSHVASYGFTVIMMDHPYDADVVEFPDGSYIEEATTNATTISEIIALGIAEIEVRVHDTSFVLDQLNNKSVINHLIPGRRCALDPNSVAMFGHSLGGATAASAMVKETRIKGGLNLDGAIFNVSDLLELGLDRPFLLFGHENNTRFYNGTYKALDFSAQTWSNFWSLLTGWKLELELSGSLHYTFSDVLSQLKTLKIKLDATQLVSLISGGDTSIPPEIARSLLKAERSLNIISVYVAAFLEFVLKGKESELLSRPCSRFPEVKFV